MIDSIKGGLISGGQAGLSRAGAGAAGADTFSSVLKESIDKVSRLQGEADNAIQGLANGSVNNIHDTMIAVEKANLSFNLMLQVKNKLQTAYEEVMRTQV